MRKILRHTYSEHMYTKIMKYMHGKIFVLACAVFVIAFGIINAGAQECFADDDSNVVRGFIEKTIQNVTKIIDSGDTNQEKTNKLQLLLGNSVDSQWMAKFAMGRMWYELKPDQQEKYLVDYKNYLTRIYVPRFKEYNGQITKIISVQDLGNQQYIVTTEIIPAKKNDDKKNENSAIKVAYRCKIENDGGEKNSNGSDNVKIRDIITENISLITTQRSEFSSIVANSGVQQLLDQMGKK